MGTSIIEPEDGMEKAGEEKLNESITYLVKNPHTNESCIACFNQSLEPGVPVVMPTRYGTDIGFILGKMRENACGNCEGCEDSTDGGSDQTSVSSLETIDGSEASQNEAGGKRQNNDKNGGRRNQKRKKDKKPVSEIYTIMRIADEKDLDKYEKNRVKEIEALTLCKEKVKSHHLDMKMVSAHFLLGESKVIFFFTADARVDFRELVKDLVSIFKMRIELRQIGVRDESRVLGGLAVCGRDYCCHSITDKLNPVSIKMAKEQNLSLNSMKISGPCGRLLCCLSYEYDYYREEKKKLPSEGGRLKIREDLLKIHEVNILSKKIYLTSPDGRVVVVPFSKVSYNDSTKRWVVDSGYIEEML